MVEKSAIEIKKKKLKAELDKPEPSEKIVKRLQDSIKRHKGISLHKRYKRIKQKRRDGRYK